MDKDRLDGKKILVVDDEPDILATIEELLPQCLITKAQSYEEGKEFLETEEFDLAVLDIMGVNGYGLLEIARTRNTMAVMLTAHAVSPGNIIKSYKKGACYYIPKAKLSHIETFLNDVLEALDKGWSTWVRWYERLANYCEEKFGPNWKEDDPGFWERMAYY